MKIGAVPIPLVTWQEAKRKENNLENMGTVILFKGLSHSFQLLQNKKQILGDPHCTVIK